MLGELPRHTCDSNSAAPAFDRNDRWVCLGIGCITVAGHIAAWTLVRSGPLPEPAVTPPVVTVTLLAASTPATAPAPQPLPPPMPTPPPVTPPPVVQPPPKPSPKPRRAARKPAKPVPHRPAPRRPLPAPSTAPTASTALHTATASTQQPAAPAAAPSAPAAFQPARLASPGGTCTAPPFPPLARRRGLQGTVILKIEILQNGNHGQIVIQQSSGYSLLDEAAIAAVKSSCRFQAARRGDQTLVSWVSIPYVFKIN